MSGARVSEETKAWREANPERVAEIASRYQESPQAYATAYMRGWREANPERAKEARRKTRERRRQREGKPILRPNAPPAVTEIEARFWARVDWSKDESICWPWTGYVNEAGYGRFRLVSRGPLVRAHRLAYELEMAPIPSGSELDHLCRNRRCCNPWHLDPVVHAENMRRSAPAVEAAGRDACIHGHKFTPENTLVRRNGGRVCRECARIGKEAFKARRTTAAQRGIGNAP